MTDDGGGVGDGRQPDLPGKVLSALDRVGHARRAHRQATATDLGLSPLQADLLTMLSRTPPPDPLVGLLAIELEIAQPTVSDALASLDRKGLVQRVPDPADRRRTTVALTKDGHRTAAEVHRRDAAFADAIASLPTDRQEATLESLLELIAQLVEHELVTVARTCLTCQFHRATDDRRHHCDLLELDLPPAELRTDCPDHEPARPTL